MNRLIILTLLLIPLASFSQIGPISVHLKTGKVISTNYAYLNSNGGFFSKPYVQIDDRKGQKLTIDLVNYVEGTDRIGKFRHFMPVFLHGSEIWSERTYHSDRVSVFYTNVISGNWTAMYKSRYFQYSFDGTPLKKLTFKNLKVDVSDYPGSMASLKKAKALMITQLVLYGVGGALITSAVVKDFKSVDSPPDPNDTSLKIPPGIIAGAIIMNIPWFINGAKQNHMVDALKKID